MMERVADTPVRRLTDVSRALTYARSLDEVLELTVACAVDLLAADRAVLMLADGEDGLLRIGAARGIDVERVGRFREPLDENLLTRLSGVLELEDRAAFMGVPLVVRGRVIGLLGVRRTGPGGGSDQDQEWLLSALADQAAVALDSARQDSAREDLVVRVGEMERERVGKDRAIQVMSHDLRTPLNAIQGYVALLAGEILGPVNERQADALRRLAAVGSHLGALLDNVLELTRAQAGQTAPALVETTLGVVVEEAREMVAVGAAQSGIVLSMGDVEPVAVMADPGRLRQVLVQLLDNAVKYSPDRGGVEIDVRRRARAGRTWGEVAIRDFGPGIPEELQPHIFEPYLRGQPQTDRARMGAGLGLAIANALTDQMGGELDFETVPGSGSTFFVRLPLSRP